MAWTKLEIVQALASRQRDLCAVLLRDMVRKGRSRTCPSSKVKTKSLLRLASRLNPDPSPCPTLILSRRALMATGIKRQLARSITNRHRAFPKMKRGRTSSLCPQTTICRRRPGTCLVARRQHRPCGARTRSSFHMALRVNSRRRRLLAGRSAECSSSSLAF